MAEFDEVIHESLAFGDFVTFFCEEKQGYVYSQLSSSVHTELVVKNNRNGDRMAQNASNVHALTFQICVPNRYKSNKALCRCKHSLDQSPSDLELQWQYQAAQKAAEQENEENSLEQIRQAGKQLQYGQIIQLKHKFTNKFIQVNTKQTASIETSNMLVELTSSTSKNAFFRVMPRYKVKTEGEEVTIGDQVALESVKCPGQYLRCSRDAFKDTSPYEGSFEINLSVRPSGFTVYRFSKALKDRQKDKNKILAGDFVRLFHKELEAYLVAEAKYQKDWGEETLKRFYKAGKFPTELSDQLVHLHLRVRPLDITIPKTLEPSSSAITFWQLEKEKSLIDGSAIEWEDQCRLRQVTSRLYLLVDDDFHVQLSNNAADPRTVFRIHPVVKGSNQVLQSLESDSYIRLQHVVSGRWLHGDNAETSAADEEMGPNESMETLNWTNAVLKEMTTSESMNYDDAFSIQRVDEEKMNDANFVAGFVPFLQLLLRDANARRVQDILANPRAMLKVTTAFTELTQFLFIDGVPSKFRQKLLRNFIVVDLVMAFLKCPFEGGHVQDPFLPIRVKCYDLLHSYLQGDSRKNELYLAKHVEFYMTQITVPGPIGCTAAVMLTEMFRDDRKLIDRVTMAHLKTFCDLLTTEKNYRYIDLLMVVCCCDGLAITENQNYIANEILAKSAREKLQAVYYTDIGQEIGKTKNVAYISTDKENWQPLYEFATQTRETDEYKFFLRQLDLFSSLCYGRNEYTINMITIDLNYLSWEEAFICMSDERIPDELRAVFCRLILELFVDVGTNYSVLERQDLVFDYKDIPLPGYNKRTRENSVLDQAMNLPFIKELKSYLNGFLEANASMTASTISRNKLIEQTLVLIYNLAKFGYYGDADDIRRLLDPLLRLIDGRSDLPFPLKGNEGNSPDVAQMVEAYRSTKRFRQKMQTTAIIKAKYGALKILDLFFNLRFNTRLARFLSEFKNTFMTEVDKNRNGPELAPFLYSNFSLEDNPSMHLKAVKTMADIFHESSFFTVEFVDIMMDLCNYQYDIIVTTAMALINRYHSANESNFSLAQQTLLVLTDSSCLVQVKIRKHLPILKLLSMNHKLNPEMASKVKSILEDFKGMCNMSDSKDAPHKINQDILYNNGVLGDVLDVLSRKIDPTLLGQYDEMKDVFRVSFELLIAMAKDNPVISQHLFDRLDDLLKVDGAVDELAELYAQVFRGNKAMCLRVQQQQIEEAVLLLARTHNPVMVQFLYCLVLVGDLPIKRNQNIVVKALLQHRKSVGLLTDTTKEYRLGVLSADENSFQEARKQVYLSSIVQLLSWCSYGDNRTVESICQCMLTMDELLTIMTLPNLCPGLRSPFVHMFYNIYMTSTSEIAIAEMKDLPQDKIWEYLSTIATELITCSDSIEQEPHTAVLLRRRPRTVHKRRDDHEHELKELLHYLFDSALPTAAACFKQHCVEVAILPEGSENKILEKLCQGLNKFAPLVYPCISRDRHLQVLISTFQSLSNIGATYGLKMPDVLMQGLVDPFGGMKQGYRQYYAQEEEINEKLRVFSRNICQAYGGLNTLRQQIGFPRDTPYNNPDEEIKLPLGKEFQSLVSCFVKSNERKKAKRYENVTKLLRQLKQSLSLTKLSERKKQAQVALDIKCLQVLRALVFNELVKLPSPDEQNAYEKQMREVRKVQEALVDFGLAPSVLPHLVRPSDELAKEIFALLTVILNNGNSHVQEKFMEYFRQTQEETFFFCVSSRLQISANAIKERRTLMSQHKAMVKEVMEAMGTQATLTSKRPSVTSKRSVKMKKESAHGLKKGLGMFVAVKSTLQGGNKVKPGDAVAVAVDKVDHKDDPKNSSDDPGAAVNDNPKPAIRFFDDMGDLFEFKDIGYLDLVLQTLAMLCDGQCIDLQHYLRDQSDNIRSVNIVSETAKLLELLYSNINHSTIELTTQLFDTLIELALGNPNNQVCIFEQKLTDYVNYILRNDTFPGCTTKQIYELKLAIGKLLKQIIEENSTLGHEKLVAAALSNEDLSKTVTSCYQMLTASSDMATSMAMETELVRETGYQYSMILARIIDLVPPNMATDTAGIAEGNTFIDSTSFTETPAWKYFFEGIDKIEILKDNRLHRAYFRVKSRDILRKTVKERLKWEVNRSSPSNKLQDFISWYTDIRRDILYQKRINAFCVGRMLAQHWRLLNILLLILTFGINLGILGTWIAPETKDPLFNYSVADGRFFEEPDPTFDKVSKGLGIVHNVLAISIFISYMLSHKLAFTVPKILLSFKKWFKKKKRNQETGGSSGNGNQVSRFEVKFFSFTTLYYIVFVCTSILGTAVSPAFFSFHLMQIVDSNQILARIIKAVTQNGRSLLWLVFFVLIIFYIFALVGFLFLRDMFADNTLWCHTLYECFITMIRDGLVLQLAQVFHLKPVSDHFSFGTYQLKAIYDLAFFVLITIIGQNIVLGIIVDTFSELRNAKWQIETDMEKFCFICGKSCHDFEHHGHGFNQHVEEEHNMWSYLYFFIYLDDTPTNNLSSLELYVYKKLEDEKIDFFPLGRALTLSLWEQENTDTRLEILLEQVNALVKRMKREDLLKARDAERLRQQEWEEIHGARDQPFTDKRFITVEAAGTRQDRPRRRDSRQDRLQLNTLLNKDVENERRVSGASGVSM